MTYAESKDRRVGSRRGGGGDLTSIVIPHPWKLYNPLLSPFPPMPFFVTITYIQEIERFFLVLVVFIYSLIQNRLYEVVGHFTVFVPSLCWCRRFDKLTVITTLRGLRDSPDTVNKKHSVEVSELFMSETVARRFLPRFDTYF